MSRYEATTRGELTASQNAGQVIPLYTSSGQALLAEVQKRSQPIIDGWIKAASAKGIDARAVLAEFREELKKVAAGN